MQKKSWFLGYCAMTAETAALACNIVTNCSQLKNVADKKGNFDTLISSQYFCCAYGLGLGFWSCFTTIIAACAEFRIGLQQNTPHRSDVTLCIHGRKSSRDSSSKSALLVQDVPHITFHPNIPLPLRQSRSLF